MVWKCIFIIVLGSIIPRGLQHWEIDAQLLTVGLLIYLLLINIVAFALMGIDKSRARRHAFRIPEKRLFISALLGGSIGAIAGMYTFRHKTKHWYFVVGMPVILFLQIVAVAALWIWLV